MLILNIDIGENTITKMYAGTHGWNQVQMDIKTKAVYKANAGSQCQSVMYRKPHNLVCAAVHDRSASRHAGA